METAAQLRYGIIAQILSWPGRSELSGFGPVPREIIAYIQGSDRRRGQAQRSIGRVGNEGEPDILVKLWDDGGLAQQGYPISDEFEEVSDLNGETYRVRYFQRAVFEYHPGEQPEFQVLLSQLGTFRYKAKYQQHPEGTRIPTAIAATPTPAAQPSPTASAQSYEGQWKGTTSQGREISFTVSSGAITEYTISFFVLGADDDVTLGRSGVNFPITGNTFSITGLDGRERPFTLSGTFSSGTSASGSIKMVNAIMVNAIMEVATGNSPGNHGWAWAATKQ